MKNNILLKMISGGLNRVISNFESEMLGFSQDLKRNLYLKREVAELKEREGC